MGWVYLDDRFPEHPKVLAAGDQAAWLFVCGIAYTNRGTSDGLIPKSVIGRLTGLAQPAKYARKLVDVGLWHDEGDSYRIHDYEIWNSEAMARRDKARKAAAARWGAKNSSGNAQASSEHEPEHPPGSASAMQYPKPQAPIGLKQASNCEPVGIHDSAAALIEAALEILADRRPPGKSNPSGYRRTILERLRHDHADRINRLTTSWRIRGLPWTPETLADALEPPQPPERPPRGLLHDEKPVCDTCSSSGLVLNDQDQAVPCPACRPAEIPA